MTDFQFGDRIKIEGEATVVRYGEGERWLRVKTDTNDHLMVPKIYCSKIDDPFEPGDRVIDDRGLLWVRTDAAESWVRITGRREASSGYDTMRTDSQVRANGWKRYPVADPGNSVRFLMDKDADYWWEVAPGEFRLSFKKSGAEGLAKARQDYERNRDDVEEESYIREHYGPVNEGRHEE